MLIDAGMERRAVELDWSRTVDRRLVHRDALAEVLLTDLVRRGESSFEVAAQWPRSHRVYRPDADGRHDPMLILETVRQTGLALSHFGFGVDRDQYSIMRDIGFTLTPDCEPRTELAATNIAISVECVDIRMLSGSLRTMTVILDFRHGEKRFATGTGTLTWMSPATFRALRERHRTQLPDGPVTVAVPSPSRWRSAADSLIAAPDPAFPRRRLLVPLDHPVYFDHPLDHVPGLLLIDAAWQAASQTLPAGYRLLGCHMECPSFTELAPDVLIDVRRSSPQAIEFEISQAEQVTTRGELRIGPVGQPPAA
ncbi:MAG TPA: ScbA/BarX family gamma-butyrolactone biosynthesis protein [Jatrophihabitans sp.]|nr:ScbA/BarX family gamma-butyrolactone biosynthesis protein [Jatrophihabitans sp.]